MRRKGQKHKGWNDGCSSEVFRGEKGNCANALTAARRWKWKGTSQSKEHPVWVHIITHWTMCSHFAQMYNGNPVGVPSNWTLMPALVLAVVSTQCIHILPEGLFHSEGKKKKLEKTPIIFFFFSFFCFLQQLYLPTTTRGRSEKHSELPANL